jgi:hypothetical protein
VVVYFLRFLCVFAAIGSWWRASERLSRTWSGPVRLRQSSPSELLGNTTILGGMLMFETQEDQEWGLETLSLFVVALGGEGPYTNEPFSVSCTVDVCRALRCKT